MFTMTIKVKDNDSTYRKDYVVYEDAAVDQDDPEIKKRVFEVLQEFGREAEKIEIKIQLEVIQP